jgi:hypothetical protein
LPSDHHWVHIQKIKKKHESWIMDASCLLMLCFACSLPLPRQVDALCDPKTVDATPCSRWIQSTTRKRSALDRDLAKPLMRLLWCLWLWVYYNIIDIYVCIYTHSHRHHDNIIYIYIMTIYIYILYVCIYIYGYSIICH